MRTKKYHLDELKLICYLTLQTNILRLVWLSVRRINDEKVKRDVYSVIESNDFDLTCLSTSIILLHCNKDHNCKRVVRCSC